MKILATIIVFVFLVAIALAIISLFRFAFVHIKAFIIRRKLSKLAEKDNKDD